MYMNNIKKNTHHVCGRESNQMRELLKITNAGFTFTLKLGGIY